MAWRSGPVGLRTRAVGLGASAPTSAGLGKPAMGGIGSARRLVGATTAGLGSTHLELFGILRSAGVGPVLPAVGLLAIRDLGSNSIAIGM